MTYTDQALHSGGTGAGKRQVTPVKFPAVNVVMITCVVDRESKRNADATIIRISQTLVRKRVAYSHEAKLTTEPSDDSAAAHGGSLSRERHALPPGPVIRTQ